MLIKTAIQKLFSRKKINYFFCSFSDSRMHQALNRITMQAADFSIFHEIISYDENLIDPQFKSKHTSILKPGIRGFGYWIWKPSVILDCLSKMKDGDMLLYCDTGCHLNPFGRERLLHYFEKARNSKKGILLFKYFPSSFPEIIEDLNKNEYMNWRNHQWCKGDLLEKFGLKHDRNFLDDYIVSAGIIIIRKCHLSTNIIKNWIEVMETDYSLIDDSHSKTSNPIGFIESRHDQSVLSCIAYRDGLDSVSAYETDAPPACGAPGKNWSALEKYPIHARRDRGNLHLRS